MSQLGEHTSIPQHKNDYPLQQRLRKLSQTRLLQRPVLWEALAIFVLAALFRLTSLNVFRAVDEEDRWAWAIDFYLALLQRDLAATLVGDGYPGIFPVWIETTWLFLGTLWRSLLQGEWIGLIGINQLIHEWGRSSNLWLQRWPVVLVNTLLVVLIFLYLRRLFSRPVALVAAVFICLDPFYLSDSRVNRAEALITGLMALSALALLTSLREDSRRQLVLSALFGGLAWLTKLQALVLIPMYGAMLLAWHFWRSGSLKTTLTRTTVMLLAWVAVAAGLFVLLWPATWVSPVETFSLMWRYLTRKVGEEGVNLFFLGQPRLDEDPGWLFYPVIFILRVSPLTLLGLLLGLGLLWRRGRPGATWQSWLDKTGLWLLLLYVLLYVGGMSLGSHKQDRFLMTVFPFLNLLAAQAWVHLSQSWSTLSNATRRGSAFGSLVLLQILIVWPYHPYYFSYFNPLIGGGPVATQLTRIGWGEGMNEVADYLNSLDNPAELTVASRFGKYLLGFDGRPINLQYGAGWERADKVVFYIQQYQRRQDPSAGLIDYFLNHIEPEKTIRINGIDYAYIYDNPIAYAADPVQDRVVGRAALFGYRWANDGRGGGTVTLIWEQLGTTLPPTSVRLWAGEAAHSDWLACTPNPNFASAWEVPGSVFEVDCPLRDLALPSGVYSLEIGLGRGVAPPHRLEIETGWSAFEVLASGAIERVTPEEAFAHLAAEAVPPTATRIDHVFDFRAWLLAYELTPPVLYPGQDVAVTLYWQARQVFPRAAHVSLQVFLGDEQLTNITGPPLQGRRSTLDWRLGEVLSDSWSVPLTADFPVPTLVRLDAELFWPDTTVPLKVRNTAGEDIPNALSFVRVKPETWPVYEGERPFDVVFGEQVHLQGVDITGEANSRTLTLYWETLAAPPESWATFVHMLAPDGSLVAQSDVPPEDGRYPSDFWQPGDVVRSFHSLTWADDLPPGTYTLTAGLYRYEDFARVPPRLSDGQTFPNDAFPVARIVIE